MCGKSYASVQGREKKRERGGKRGREKARRMLEGKGISGGGHWKFARTSLEHCASVCVSITISVRACVCVCVCIVAWNYEIISWLVTRLKYPVEARPRCQPQAKERCRGKKSKSRGREG